MTDEEKTVAGLRVADRLWDVLCTLNCMDGRYACGLETDPWGAVAKALRIVLREITGSASGGDDLYRRCVDAYEKPSLHYTPSTTPAYDPEVGG